jgi:hypothetical protein
MLPSPPVYACRKVAAPLCLDGELLKSPWLEVSPAWLVPADSDPDAPLVRAREGLADHAFFTTGYPPPREGGGAPPFKLTAFGACWDDTHLFVAFQMQDDDIWGNLTDRDDPLYDEEVVEVFISPTGDLREYYEFEVSPRDVVFDARVLSPDLHRATMRVDTDWNCPGLRTAVQVRGTLDDRDDHDQGWSVELAIPFTAFPEASAPRPGVEWRANFYRIERGETAEFTAWSPTFERPANFHVPERFGVLRFEE